MSEKRTVLSPKKFNRSKFLRALAVTSSAAALSACGFKEAFRDSLQRNGRSLSKAEIAEIISRLETKYTQQYGKEVYSVGQIGSL